MKKLLTILTAVCFTIVLSSQVPQKMSYQAVIRDASGHLVTTQIGMQISIIQGTVDGTVVYSETQTPTPNINGLVTIEIGDGDPGAFSEIDWSAGNYFIKTETDPAGGTNYTITGTSQVLSVPYALHANTVASYTENDPVFVASPANGITGSSISNWNTAFAWGDHSTAGYISSYSETDPSVPAGVNIGDMQYWNGTAWVTLPPGIEGQVLTLRAGGPTWSTVLGIKFFKFDYVYNPSTGKTWMDRNLGASQVATSSTDAAAYGELYQWGRLSDGHQARTSGTTTTLSSTDNPGHSDFIFAPSSPYDWRSPQNTNLWQGVNGVNNPCPEGYRIPTSAELDEERASWSSNDLITPPPPTTGYQI